jgi:ATP-dependent 26S proteasome regulatory subunit
MTTTNIWNSLDGSNSFLLSSNNLSSVENLPAGAYTISSNMMGVQATKVALKEEELITFNNSPAKGIIEEINMFWGMKEEYTKIDVPYRRGILMYGPPGTGKSGIVRLISDQVIANNGLAIIIQSISDFELWLPILNDKEKDRNVVAILEDMEQIIKYYEQDFLQILDGINNYRPGLVFLGTTNNLDEINSRCYRPSRFDLLMEIKKPNDDTRIEYIQALCKRYDQAFRSDIVEASKDMSFAHVKEMLVSSLLYKRPLEELRERLLMHCQNDAEESDDD